MDTKENAPKKQKIQSFRKELGVIKNEIIKYKKLFEEDGTTDYQQQLDELQKLVTIVEIEIKNQQHKISNLENSELFLFNKKDNSSSIPFDNQDLEDIKQQIQNDNNGTPFVAGDLEIRITANFVLKEIIVLDEQGQQISYSETNYLEIAAKSGCVLPGKKYTIKIIGKSKNDIITKIVEKKEKGDLVIYVLPNYSSVFNEYKKLVVGGKYMTAVEYVIKIYGFDKNQCPSYKLKITDDPWTGLTTEGAICGTQTINIRTGFLKTGIGSEAGFSQIVSAIGHEFVHIRQKGDIGMTEHIEREFLAYYWEVFQQGLPVMPFRRKYAAEQAINKYAKQFSDSQKEKYKSHIKRITNEYDSKYKN